MKTPEQLSLLPEPPFMPLMPSHGSLAEQALCDLLERDLEQPDWLDNGWRLAAAVKELGYLGWEPQSIRVRRANCKRPIARYSLLPKAKQALFTMRQQGGSHANE